MLELTKQYKTAFPTSQMTDWLQPRIQTLRDEYNEAKDEYDEYEEERELGYYLEDRDEDEDEDENEEGFTYFKEKNYHPQYKIELNEFKQLKDMFLIEFRLDLFDVNLCDYDSIFLNSVEKVMPLINK